MTSLVILGRVGLVRVFQYLWKEQRFLGTVSFLERIFVWFQPSLKKFLTRKKRFANSESPLLDFSALETFSGKKCSIFSRIVFESYGITSGVFWHCKFNGKFHNSMPVYIENTLLLFNFVRGSVLGRSRLDFWRYYSD